MSPYDRVSVTVGVILVGVVLSLVLRLPTRSFQFEPLGTPLTLNLTGAWLASALLVGMVCAGTEANLRAHPSVRRGEVRFTFPHWILPGLTTLALASFLPQYPNLLYWLLGLTVGGLTLAWLILAQYHTLGRRKNQGVRVGLSFVAYMLALSFFTIIYRTRLRSLVTATAVALIAFLLSLSLLYDEERSLRRTLLHAAIIGIVVGETTWALNYWRANASTVGVLLMLLFYVLVGLVREHLRNALNRYVVIEFLVVATVGLLVVIRFGT